MCADVALGVCAGGSLPFPEPGVHPKAGAWGRQGPQRPYTPSESCVFSTQITLSRLLLLGL